MTTAKRQPRRSWGKLRTRASGRWEASYMHDLARHTAPATYTAKMDAEMWLGQERRLIERQEWTPPALRAAATTKRGRAFGEYATAWIEQRTLKPRTRQGYSETLAGPLASLHTVPLVMLTPERVRAWFAGLGTKTPTKNAHAYQLLRSVLNTAVGDGLLTTNPCTIRAAGTTNAKRQAVILTPDEIAAVANEIQPAPLKALVLVAAWAGLRWGELTELRRSDISADCTVITVARAVTHRGGCNIDTTKSDRVHTVIVPPHMVGDLVDHMANHVGAEPDSLQFQPIKACHYSEKTFREHFAPACKAVGITKVVRIHDLRHFAGSQTARVANLTETMGRLGHSTAKASLLYQQVTSGRPAEIAAALSVLAAVPDTTG